MNDDLSSRWWVFPGFEIDLVTTGLSLPTNICFVPKPKDDPLAPLLYINELYGQVKVVTVDYSVHTYAKGLLNYEADYKFPGTGESGMTGITMEPESGDLLLSMIYEKDGKMFSRIVRTKSVSRIKLDSRSIIMDKIPAVRAAHQIQALTIGYDKKLYVNVGDGMIDPNTAQDDDDLRGKVLRMELDGSVPADNPKEGSYVFAKGFRNPFGARWRNSDKSLYISDNGPNSDDRIAKVEAGKNYGWPRSMRTNSIMWWNHCQAPTAIDFMQGGQFPDEFNDELFVALFGRAYVHGRDPKGKKIVKIALNEDATAVKGYDEFVFYRGEGPASCCGLQFGPDGLYFTDLHGELDGKAKKPSGNLYRIKAME